MNALSRAFAIVPSPPTTLTLTDQRRRWLRHFLATYYAPTSNPPAPSCKIRSD